MLPLFCRTMQQSHNMSTSLMNENNMFNTIFGDLIANTNWGYGNKRITLQLKNSITEKIPFSGFGYKDKDGILYVGVRMWLDQGDYSKLKQYDKNYTIMSQFTSIIQEFDHQYSNKI